MEDSHPRLSCADSAFPRLSHEGALGVIRDLGIHAVDVFVVTGSEHTSPETVFADPAGAAEDVARRVAEQGLEIADVFAVFGHSFEELAPNHPDPAIRGQARERFDALVRFAARLDAPGVTILPGTPFPGVEDRASLELAAAELEERAATAGELGLRLAVEPHFGSIVATPDATEEFLALTSDVALTLDVSHFAYQDIPQDASASLLARTGHVHLRQARPGVIQARVSEGVIDFPSLRDRLLEAGYTGYFGLEYQWEEGWLDFTHVDCVTETAELRDVMLGGLGANE